MPTIKTVSMPTNIKVIVAIIDLRENRLIPQIPCPLVQPLLNLVPKPTNTPPIVSKGKEFEIDIIVDGTNIDDTYGCFFLLRAGAGVDIDPSRYAFYVSEKGYSPHKLDLEVRTNDNLGNPTGGDRNGTYDWTVDGELWSGGEYLGFDMPTEDMGIDIVDGNIYEVMIKNPKGVVIFRGSFVYTCQSDL